MSQLEESMATLARHYYAEGRIGEWEYLAARDALEEKLDTLRAESEKAPVRIPGRTLTELWDNADVASRRLVLGELIESIVVGPGVRGRRSLDPGRLSITWR